MTDTAKLVVKVGEEINKSFDLIKSEIVIGRDPSIDIVIDDIEISRKHLKLTKEKGDFIAEDLKSTNGTLINGKSLQKPSVLVHGDLITVGTKHVFEFMAKSRGEEYSVEDPVDEKSTEEAPLAIDSDVDKKTTKSKEKIRKPRKGAGEKTKVEEEGKSNFLKDKPTWLVVLLAVLVFIVVFCVVPLIVIEVTNQWCNLFAGFFNSMSPGVCP